MTLFLSPLMLHQRSRLSRLSVRLPASDLQTLKLLLKALPKPSKKLSAKMKRNPSRQSLKKQAQRSLSSNSAYLQKPRLSHGAAALIIVFFLMSSRFLRFLPFAAIRKKVRHGRKSVLQKRYGFCSRKPKP